MSPLKYCTKNREQRSTAEGLQATPEGELQRHISGAWTSMDKTRSSSRTQSRYTPVQQAPTLATTKMAQIKKQTQHPDKGHQETSPQHRG